MTNRVTQAQRDKINQYALKLVRKSGGPERACKQVTKLKAQLIRDFGISAERAQRAISNAIMTLRRR